MQIQRRHTPQSKKALPPQEEALDRGGSRQKISQARTMSGSMRKIPADMLKVMTSIHMFTG